MKLLEKLWNDELGVIISAELVLVATILVLGLITGLTCLQEAVVGEFRDLAGAFSSLDQSYYFRGMRGCFSFCGRGSRTFGSAYSDNTLVAIPADADIVPCPVQPMAHPVTTPACPLDLEAPMDALPCDPCENLPLDHVPFDNDAGPQPVPRETVPVPAPATEVETTSATALTLAGPRFP